MINKQIESDIQIAAGQLLKEKEYWLNELKGEILKSNFPYDNTLSVESYSRIRNQDTFQFSPKVCSMLMKLGTASDPKIFLILLTTVIILLDKYTANKDIIVGTTIEKQKADNDYINTILPIRYVVDDKLSFKEMLLGVREKVVDAFRHPNYPIQALLSELGLTTVDGNEFLLFDVGVIMENIHTKDYLTGTNPSIIFMFLRTGDNIQCKVEYIAELYEKSKVAKIVNYLERLIEIVLNNVDVELKDVVPLSDEEIESMSQFNNTDMNYPKDKLIHELIEEQALKFPNKVAVEFSGISISYKDLDDKSNQLAWLLRSKGVKADTIVGLMVERSINMIIGILGVLKSGGAYLPLDPGFIQSRNNFQLQDSNAKLLITTSKFIESINFDGEIILLDNSENFCYSADKLPRVSDADNLAYMIYTSGTTGQPKGVMIEQKSLVNYIWWAAKTYVKNAEMKFPLFTSFAFDLTVTSIFTPLVTGNTIIVYGDEDGKEFIISKIIKENKVGVIKLTPSHLKILKGQTLVNSNIRCLVLGGENLEASLAREITNIFDGNVDIYNEYGPTEATVGCMIYKYDVKRNTAQYVPIGRPIDNIKIYLLDRNLKPIIAGAAGEIYISGEGIAKGYYNRNTLTDEKFVDDPLVKGKKMYKTGDMARWVSDDCIEFIGRTDDQIKLRGYRIEPGEIEARLKNHNIIQDAVIVLNDGGNGDKSLCAYIVTQGEINVIELKKYLIDVMPSYMIPSVFIEIDSIPLNENGKIDKKKLLGQGHQISLGMEYVSPRNDTERKLVKIWENVLETEHIGIKDEFFNLGGDSIKSIRLLNDINKEFGTSLELVKLYENTSIENLAMLIDDQNKNNTQEDSMNVKNEIDDFKNQMLNELM